MSDKAPNNRPLAGLRVIDIATYIAAPCCATIMAEFGAEVIKVEQPREVYGTLLGMSAGDQRGLEAEDVI